MPNTPGQIGYGVTGYLFAKSPEDIDRVLIEKSYHPWPCA